MNTMSKITIFGLLIVVETPDEPKHNMVPAPRTPTLNELFARYFQGDDEQTDIIFEEEHGPVFTR